MFAANTFWEQETERATTKQTAAGTWQMTLRVRARKSTVDPAGVETGGADGRVGADRRLHPHREAGRGLRRDADVEEVETER
jgi:hypothetical protein